jgi:hypothetical protein
MYFALLFPILYALALSPSWTSKGPEMRRKRTSSESFALILFALGMGSMLVVVLKAAIAHPGGEYSQEMIRFQAKLFLASMAFAVAAPLIVLTLPRGRRRGVMPKRKPNPMDDFA